MSDVIEIKVPDFQIHEILGDRLIFIIGKRGTGKSVLLEDLMFRMKDRWDFVIAMTPTMSSYKMFAKHIPMSFIFDKGVDKAHLERVIRICRGLSKTDKVRHVAIILDDCMADKKFFNTSYIRDLFMNGRHFYLSFICATQYCMDIPRDLRSQIDYVFLLRESNVGNKQRLHENFGGVLEKSVFYKVLDACTENNECLVVNMAKPSNNPAECLGSYKASLDHPPYLLARKAVWLLDQLCGKADDEETDILQELDVMGPKTNNKAPVTRQTIIEVKRETARPGTAVKLPVIEPPPAVTQQRAMTWNFPRPPPAEMIDINDVMSAEPLSQQFAYPPSYF